MKRKPSVLGFTLLELLVTLSIVGGIITVVLACFEGGFRVYARIRDFGSREAEVYLAGEMLERDLGYFIPAAEYRFQSRELFFLRSPLHAGSAEAVQLRAPESGGLSYWVGVENGSQARRSGITLIPEGLDVTFSFAAPAHETVWLPVWESQTNLPSAVRMTVRGIDTDGDMLMERTMVLSGLSFVEDEN